MYANKRTLARTDVRGKRVVVRLDLNVPLENGAITDDERIAAALPTLKHLVENECRIVCLSHLGRVKSLDDRLSGKKSLRPVAERLQRMLGDAATVRFLGESAGQGVADAAAKLTPKEILLLENTRYNDVGPAGETVKAESKNDPALGGFWASLGEVFVNDAFGTAHRAHASNAGIAAKAKTSCVGFLIEKELAALRKVTHDPARPLVVVLGGAKVADKLGVIKRLLPLADRILIGGGMAYTFFKAQGKGLGATPHEPDLVGEAAEILGGPHAAKIVLPVDLRGATEFADVPPIVCGNVDGPWPEGFIGMDIGPKTVALFRERLGGARTVFWNGPVGVFEFANFCAGTEAIAKRLAELTSEGAYTVIGGGDSAAAANKLGTAQSVSFVSTGGGASLALLEGSRLPGIEPIQNG